MNHVLSESSGAVVISLKMFWRELWKSLKIFLTYGEVRKHEDGDDGIDDDDCGVRERCSNRQLQTNQDTKFNGLVTSLLMFVFLTTFIIIFFIAPFVTHDNIQTSTKLILITLMSTGFVVMAIFTQKEKEIFLSSRKKSLGLRGQLVLIGITIFFVLGSFLDLFYLIFLFHCFPVYIQCKGRAIYDNLISIIFHFVRVMYFAGQTAFCTSYRGLRFKDRCLTRYGLMLLHVANLAVWFDVLLRQTSAKLKFQLQPSYFDDCNTSTFENNYFLGCISMNGTYNGIFKMYGGNVIYPFLFQFSILVLECYVHWFIQCGQVEPTLKRESLRIRTSSYYSARDEQSSPSLSQSNTQRYHTNQKKYFIITSFMNILFVLLIFLPLIVEKDEISWFLNVSSIYCIIYWCINIILTFVGYYCTTAFKDNPKKKKFKSLNYLLIFSSIGPYIYVVTALETIAQTDSYKLGESKFVTIIKEITFFFSIFCQIPFCFLAGRVVLPSKNHENNFKVNCFKAITLHHAACNCVLWIVNSFLNVFNQEANLTLQTNYYRTSSWLFIDNIVQPLSVFFRFNSFLLFTAAHVRMNQLFAYKIHHAE